MGKWAENLFGIHEALGSVPSPVETRYNGAHWELLGGLGRGPYAQGQPGYTVNSKPVCDLGKPEGGREGRRNGGRDRDRETEFQLVRPDLENSSWRR